MKATYKKKPAHHGAASFLSMGLIVVGLSLAAQRSQAANTQVQIVWDKELAFPSGRHTYEKLLQQCIEQASSLVRRAFGFGPKQLGVHIHTRANYQKRFGSFVAIHSGAHYYNGAIQVNGGARLNDRFTGILVHEMVHAFLDHQATAAKLPMWLNEGVAEYLKWRFRGLSALAPNQTFELKNALNNGKLIPLPTDTPFSPYQYLQSYAAVLYMAEKYGQEKLYRLLDQIIHQMTFEQALDKVLGMSLSQFERSYAAWIDEF